MSEISLWSEIKRIQKEIDILKSFDVPKYNPGLFGASAYWDDLRVEPISRGIGANDPVYTKYFDNGAGSRGVYAYAMTNAVAGSEKEVYFSVQMPHAWKEGSAVDPHVHWFPATAGGAGTAVRWGLEYTKAKIGSAFGNTTIAYASVSTAGTITTAGSHSLTSLGSISTVGDTLSTVWLCRLFRDSANAADSYTGVAGLLYIDFHYQIDSLGSRTEFIK